MDPVIDDVNRIIYLLAEHKKSVSHLYDSYAIKFPDRPYWKGLAAAKQKNYQIIQTIYFDAKDPATQTTVFDENVFRSIAIKTSLEWIERLIAEVERHTIVNALSYALDLEQAKIEQRYFDIFKTESKQIQDILPGLGQEAQQHVDLLRQELEKVRNEMEYTQ